MRGLERLTDEMYNFLLILHRRVWIDGKIDEQRFQTFKQKVREYEKKGYEVVDFKRYVKYYEGKNGIGRNRRK
jgi:hypothetical protein